MSDTKLAMWFGPGDRLTVDQGELIEEDEQHIIFRSQLGVTFRIEIQGYGHIRQSTEMMSAPQVRLLRTSQAAVVAGGFSPKPDADELELLTEEAYLLIPTKDMFMVIKP